MKWVSSGKHVDDRLIKDLEVLWINVDTGYGREYPYATQDGFPECIVGVDEHNSVLYVRHDMLNTCHAVHMGEPYNEHYYKCSACGHMWDNNFGRPRFCSWCGSRVIGEERD